MQFGIEYGVMSSVSGREIRWSEQAISSQPLIRRCLVLCLFCSAVTLSSGMEACADEGLTFFEKRIRPILVQQCYKCHSASAIEVKGGLLLDSRDGIRKGGETAAAVVPGDVTGSLLMEAIRHESLEMPPGKKLPESVIADFTTWIEMGAPDPREGESNGGQSADASWQEILAARRQWWSLLPVQDPDLPVLKDAVHVTHPIDRFVNHKLEQAGLKQGKPAEARTLIRRLSLVLIGLPPLPQVVQQFVADYEREPDSAYAALVDDLLNSPHFGERWARHWMDVVHFSETHGNEWNYEVHHAWRYRDYLIRAFNRDVPYDQLVREHIAGDLLARPRRNEQEQINESAIGTAFFRFGEVNHDDCIDLRQIGYDLVDNQLDTLTKAFQATTVACARCHDHKIDAVSMQDYYALLGILRSSRQVAHTIDSPLVNREPMQRLKQIKIQIRHELAQRWLHEAQDLPRYLLAAEEIRHEGEAVKPRGGFRTQRLENWVNVLNVESPALENPISPWLSMLKESKNRTGAPATEWLPDSWKQIEQQFHTEQSQRTTFNSEQFDSFGDFRTGRLNSWKASGQGIRDDTVHGGDFAIAHSGDNLVNSILPAGIFTHKLSEKLNGGLRSPVLATEKKRISLEVMGEHSAAVRLVSNNCQLNYRNYRALTNGSMHWITFEVPDDAVELRSFVELFTKLDNPKFPDQLGTLGGDKENHRIPWEQAVANPRSYFGITRAVLHDVDETPRPTLSHVQRLFAEQFSSPPQALSDVAKRYGIVAERAVQSWADHRADDDDVRWLNWLVQNGLLDNSVNQWHRLIDLVAEYREVEEQHLSVPRVVPGLADLDDGFAQSLLAAGNYAQPGPPVARRYLEVLGHSADAPITQGSGRRELAEQIASPKNPLTARVMVNRVWHHLFGTGIVRTVDDFGHVGELPSHPELLDHLATQFVSKSWSIKQLIKYIVTSQTFRASNRITPDGAQIDPQNRLMHHFPARRMEAEAIRDTILFTSGRLDRTLFGLSILPYREKPNVDRRLFPGPLDGHGRRSAYIKVRLMEGPKFLEAFNFPGGKVTQGRRDVTNVPTQALALLNDAFVLQQAGFWADRLVQHKTETVPQRIERMFLTALGRPPADDEREEFAAFVQQLAEFHQSRPADVLTAQDVWKDLAHVMLNLKEFIFIP